MSNKPSRYYEIKEGFAHVYSEPFPENSPDVSIVPVKDLQYYRNNFNLQRVWTNGNQD